MTASNIDTTGYVDLTLYDKTAQEIYDDALSYAKWVMPDWVPAETNIENVVMQALALMIAESEYTINRLPNAVAEVLMRLHGIERVTGSYPTVTVTFTATDATGYTIPAGTEALYDLGDGGDPIVFVLGSAVVIAPGSTTANGVMTGSLAESRFNNLPAGTTFTVVTPVPYILSIKTAALVTGGADAETDSAYFNRAMLRLSRLTEALILPSHFESYALEYSSNIYRAKTLDRYDPDLTGNVPGDNNGHVTVAVFGNGVPVSAAEKTALLNALEAASVSSLTMHVIDPEDINMIGVHCVYVPLASANEAVTSSAAKQALSEYLSTSTWPWSTVVRWSNIVGLIENVSGVDYITTLYLSVNKIAWDASLFYTSIANWANTTNCTVAWDSTVSYTAIGGSLKITATAAGNVETRSTSTPTANTYTATAAKDYWVSGNIYAAASTVARTCRIGVSWYNASNTLISSNQTTAVVSTPGGWISLSGKFTSPALTTKAVLWAQIDSAGMSQVFYLDNITLSEYQAQNADLTLVGNGPLVMAAEVEVGIS